MAKLTKPRGRFPLAQGKVDGIVYDRGDHLEFTIQITDQTTGKQFHMRMTQAEWERITTETNTNEVYAKYQPYPYKP